LGEYIYVAAGRGLERAASQITTLYKCLSGAVNPHDRIPAKMSGAQADPMDISMSADESVDMVPVTNAPALAVNTTAPADAMEDSKSDEVELVGVSTSPNQSTSKDAVTVIASDGPRKSPRSSRKRQGDSQKGRKGAKKQMTATFDVAMWDGTISSHMPELYQ